MGKYEEALARIERLEKGTSCRSMDCSASTASMTPESAAVSLCSSPRQSPPSPPMCGSNGMPCDVVLLQEQSRYSDTVNSIPCQGVGEKVDHLNHLSEKITDAINDSTLVPLLPTSHGPVPERCTSLSSSELPSFSNVEPSSVSPSLNSDVSHDPDELEFGEFLLDAAEWL